MNVASYQPHPSSNHHNPLLDRRHSQTHNYSAFSTLATSFDIAKSALVKSWKKSGEQRLSGKSISTLKQSVSTPGLYSIISKSSSDLGGSIKSLARKTSTHFQPYYFKSSSSTDIQSNHNDKYDNLFDVPPIAPVILEGSDELKHLILNEELISDIRGLMPLTVQLQSRWTLAYSLEKHGASLNTLYRNCEPFWDERPKYLLVIRDKTHCVFGAYVNEPFRKVSESKRYYGNGECFLWKFNECRDDEDIYAKTPRKNRDSTIPRSSAPRFQAFPYTGLNDFVIFSTPNFLSLGGGDGHYGLWIDEGLTKGISNHSLTFGNDPLSNFGTKFEILDLEVWRI
jgi:hypothetical protein